MLYLCLAKPLEIVLSWFKQYDLAVGCVKGNKDVIENESTNSINIYAIGKHCWGVQ